MQNGWLAFKDHMNHLVLDRLKRFPGQVIWKEYTPQVACSCTPERSDCWPDSGSAAAHQQMKANMSSLLGLKAVIAHLACSLPLLIGL